MKNFKRSYWHELLLPHYPKLVEFTNLGFKKMIECKSVIIDGDVSVDIEPKTCANIIHDVFEAYAKDYFNNLDGVVTGKHDGVFGIYFKEKCFIRFNKLNDDYSISNAKTAQRDKFLSQQDLSIFPNEVVYLNLGYTVDAFWDAINGIHLVCWNNGKLWEIDVIEEKTIYEQYSLDIQESYQQNILEKRRATLKKAQSLEQKKENKQKSS